MPWLPRGCLATAYSSWQVAEGGCPFWLQSLVRMWLCWPQFGSGTNVDFCPSSNNKEKSPVLLQSCQSCWLMFFQIFGGSSTSPLPKLLYHAKWCHWSLGLSITWVPESNTALNYFISCPIFCSWWLLPHFTFGYWSLGLFLYITFGILLSVTSRQTFTPPPSVTLKVYLSSPFFTAESYRDCYI